MNKWIVTGLALGAATAVAASGDVIASLDDDPGTLARWAKRMVPDVRAEFGASSFGAAARQHAEQVDSRERTPKVSDLWRAAQWWWSRLPSTGNKAYGATYDIADLLQEEARFMKQETPAAAAAAERFDRFYTELSAWRIAGLSRDATGAELARLKDELVHLADALDHDHNTEAPIANGDLLDAGEVVGGFVDDIVNPPLRAVAWGAGKVGNAAVKVGNGVIDAAGAAATNLVKGLGMTAIVTLGAVTVAGVVLWKYGGGKQIVTKGAGA